MILFRYSFLILLLLNSLPTCSAESLTADLANAHDRPWAGRTFWSNDLETWSVHNHQLLAQPAGKNLRALHVLTRTISARLARLETSIEIIPPAGQSLAKGSRVAFWLGTGATMGDRRSNEMVQSPISLRCGILAGLDGESGLFISSQPKSDSGHLPANRVFPAGPLRLRVVVEPILGYTRITLSLESIVDGSLLDRLSLGQLDSSTMSGGLALVIDGGTAPLRFDNWELAGGKLDQNDEGTFGPIAGFHYHLDDTQKLNLDVQLTPQAKIPGQLLRIQLLLDGRWKPMAEAVPDPATFSAGFQIHNWNADSSVPFRVVYSDGEGGSFEKHGLVRRDPVDKPNPVLAVLDATEFLKKTRLGLGGLALQKIPQTLEHILVHEPDLLYMRICNTDNSADFRQRLMERMLFHRHFHELLRSTPCLLSDRPDSTRPLRTITYAKMGWALFDSTDADPTACASALWPWQLDWTRQDMKLLLTADQASLTACGKLLADGPRTFAPLLTTGPVPEHSSNTSGPSLLTLPQISNSIDAPSRYAVVIIDKQKQTFNAQAWPVDNYPLHRCFGQISGWPVEITPYADTTSTHVLSEFHVQNIDDPVVRVCDESSGRLLYSQRIKGHSHQPKVPAPGLYSVEVGEPGTPYMKTYRNIQSQPANAKRAPAKIEVFFR